MKRICSLLLALVMVFSLFSVTANANVLDNGLNNYVREGKLDNGLYYDVYEDHVEIRSYEGDGTKLVIPSEIEGLPVTSINDGVFYLCSHLIEIVIPDSVTSIGDYAFEGCSSLTSIVIPDSVTFISDYAFEDCSSLISIVIPDGVTSIGRAAFRDCSSLTSIIIPDSVTFIDRDAFSNCSSLTSIDISCGITSISDYTFSWCTSLTSIVIPDGVTSIGDYAFDVCFSLASIVIPDGVTSIGNYAFDACTNLTSIVIPDSVTSIGDYAFYGCETLSSVVIPDSVTYIGDEAFMYCSSLTSIDLPDGITSIGKYAFSICSSLTSIVIPDGVTSIGEYAFFWCDSLSDIVIPDSVTSIEHHAFMKSERLTTIYFEGDAPKLGEYVFAYVTATAYYPAGNATWTADAMQDYGGNITWVAYDPNAPVNPFTDVPAGCWYEAPVLWALDNGITDGTSDTTFSPGNQCLRAHVVTFLWNAEKTPEPAAASSSFSDVPAGAWYEKPVLWAVENGITSGVSPTKFGAGDVCSRYQVVYFLWKAAGSPEPKTTVNPFTDVNPGHFFYKAVLWAVENDITSGTSDTTFSPTQPCNRAQVVTFLYKAYN